MAESIGSDHATTIREATLADAPGIAEVHIDAWRTTYRGILPDEYLSKMSYDERVARWEAILLVAGAEGERVYVAVTPGGRVVGFADGGPEREGDKLYRGELYAIYILASHHGIGIGRRLVAEVAAHIQRSGFSTMLVWVLSGNDGMRHFCLALGGRPLRTMGIQIGGIALQETAYGWSNLGPLLPEA